MTENAIGDVGLVMLAIILAFIFFILGANASYKSSKQRAVKAGVAYYKADENGKSEFTFITPCTNCVAHIVK